MLSQQRKSRRKKNQHKKLLEAGRLELNERLAAARGDEKSLQIIEKLLAEVSF